MKKLFDELAYDVSRAVTKKYSTSFSIGILALKPHLRPFIYSIYGYVRLADEIVDSFHGYDKETLLTRFNRDTWNALSEGISLNPILESFQKTVNKFNINESLIEQFLHSMEMDLKPINYTNKLYDEYILGSAEVVGLMCLHVFTEGNTAEYKKLKPYAMKLGSAFQKINFLRDLNEDYLNLGRTYFPNIDMNIFDNNVKKQIENEIETEFKEALTGIKMLPKSSRLGVYLAYKYYSALLIKIKKTSAQKIKNKRMRIPNTQKLGLAITGYIQFTLRII